jgi:ribose/xylose/arabinose/galactoside ABC-type transport system permease subunit
MGYDTLFVVISIMVLALMAAFYGAILGKQKERKRISALGGLAFASIVAGIAFGETRMLGYGLIGLGVALAVIDAVIQIRKKV